MVRLSRPSRPGRTIVAVVCLSAVLAPVAAGRTPDPRWFPVVHTGWIVAGASLMGVQALLILGLLAQRRKRVSAEQALREGERRQRDLGGRLIRAQEDERCRIARELHDDLQQRLALLAMQLDAIALGGDQPGLDGRARDLWRQTVEIASEVHRLSYRLHPSKLEALGLLATVQGYCRELSPHGLRVAFTHEAVPEGIPADTALCVFRIIQESLQNVLKHSGAKEARLHMSGAGAALRVTVSDAGRGFDPGARPNGGLGMVSMRERLHLVGGTMTIRSRPGHGTVIEFDVPFGGREQAALAAGAPREARI
jgi:signal transduction histidine kinase